MHEYSIVQALLEQCESHAKEHKATRITRVMLKIGKLSGVEPYLLQSAFDAFKEGGICRDALLQMELQNLVLYCEACGKHTEQSEVRYQCKHCQSAQVRAVDGEEMFLMRLEME